MLTSGNFMAINIFKIRAVITPHGPAKVGLLVFPYGRSSGGVAGSQRSLQPLTPPPLHLGLCNSVCLGVLMYSGGGKLKGGFIYTAFGDHLGVGLFCV